MEVKAQQFYAPLRSCSEFKTCFFTLDFATQDLDGISALAIFYSSYSSITASPDHHQTFPAGSTQCR